MGALAKLVASEQSGQSEESILLNAVMEACVEGLAIVERGRVLHANRGFAQTFGYVEGAEVEGRSLVEFIPESLFLFAPDPQSFNRPTSSECLGVRRDGSEARILAASAVCCIRQRELQVMSFREMSERNRAQAPAFEKSERLDSQKLELRAQESQSHSQRLETLGRVVGGVAHDFNNLLTGILLYCDLLVRGLEPDSPLRCYVEEIRKAGSHSTGLIRQLLSAAQPQAEDSGTHSWSEVIGGMRNFLARMLGENIELAEEFDPAARPVCLSAAALRQIVLNLLLNARDAMPDGGRITVTVRNCVDCQDSPSELLDGYVELSVADTGIGMDAATRARACEPFFSTKASGQGTGLGLATVQRIVNEANGSLEVRSEPGQGTRVVVRLPHGRLPITQANPELRVIKTHK